MLKAGAARMAMAAPIEGGSETMSLQVTVTYELALPTLIRPRTGPLGRSDGQVGQNVAA